MRRLRGYETSTCKLPLQRMKQIKQNLTFYCIVVSRCQIPCRCSLNKMAAVSRGYKKNPQKKRWRCLDIKMTRFANCCYCNERVRSNATKESLCTARLIRHTRGWRCRVTNHASFDSAMLIHCKMLHFCCLKLAKVENWQAFNVWLRRSFYGPSPLRIWIYQIWPIFAPIHSERQTAKWESSVDGWQRCVGLLRWPSRCSAVKPTGGQSRCVSMTKLKLDLK